MRVFIKTLKIVFIVFVILIIFINVQYLVSNAITGDKLARIGKYTYFNMNSDSMKPYLKEGDLVIVKEEEFYSIDDVITFYYNGEPTTNRIVTYEGDSIITKSDTAFNNNTPITKDKIIGKVVFKVGLIGTIMEIFKNPVVIVVIMGMSFFLFLYDTKNRNTLPLE